MSVTARAAGGQQIGPKLCKSSHFGALVSDEELSALNPPATESSALSSVESSVEAREAPGGQAIAFPLVPDNSNDLVAAVAATMVENRAFEHLVLDDRVLLAADGKRSSGIPILSVGGVELLIAIRAISDQLPGETLLWSPERAPLKAKFAVASPRRSSPIQRGLT